MTKATQNTNTSANLFFCFGQFFRGGPSLGIDLQSCKTKNVSNEEVRTSVFRCFGKRRRLRCCAMVLGKETSGLFPETIFWDRVQILSEGLVYLKQQQLNRPSRSNENT
uniref:SpoU_methylase domain-containing protein n=1 Tax=Steinernema glaseri TaxID=37863 RepID=A0A1I7YXX4_9BILA